MDHQPEIGASYGTLAQVVIINRLSFDPQPLYLLAEWAKQHGIDQLLGIDASWLDDDRLGAMMEALAKHAAQIWLKIIVRAVSQFSVVLEYFYFNWRNFCHLMTIWVRVFSTQILSTAAAGSWLDIMFSLEFFHGYQFPVYSRVARLPTTVRRLCFFFLGGLTTPGPSLGGGYDELPKFRLACLRKRATSISSACRRVNNPITRAWTDLGVWPNLLQTLATLQASLRVVFRQSVAWFEYATILSKFL